MINVWDYSDCDRVRVECVDGQIIEGELTGVDDAEESGFDESGISVYTENGQWLGIAQSEIKTIEGF